MMNLSDKIIKHRKANGWSQEDFAEKLNVSRQAISRWENATALPDAQNILQISRLFHVTTDYLLDVDISKENERIEEIKKRAWDEYNKFPHKSSHRAQQECIHNAVKVIEEGLKTYPDSWKLKEEMLLFRMCWFDDDINIVRENQREMIKICDDSHGRY